MPLVNGNKILQPEPDPEPKPLPGLIIISIVKFCTPKSEVTYLPDPALSRSGSSSADSIVCFCLTKTVE